MARLSLLLALPALVAGNCEVTLSSINGSFPPLLIQHGDFKLPTAPVLTFEDGEELQLYCHGSQKHQAETYLERKKDSVRESSVILSCSRGKFRVKGTKEQIHVESASCNRKQEPRLSLVPEQCSPVGADGRKSKKGSLVKVSVGWQVGESYIEQIGACVDSSVAGTVWTQHTVHGASIDFQEKDPVRPSFRVDTSGSNRFFPWTTSSGMNSLYSKRMENTTVESELDGVTTMDGESIIETSSRGTNYFAKGHMAPDAAFIYNVQQDATYYFINVAPQFQSFNNGNWKSLEMAVRKLASSLGRDLQVVTGTHDILQYPNSHSRLTDIFLNEESSLVPAPKYYWKLVRDPETDTAAVFIGLNNPHIKKAPQKLCTDRCAEMSSWVKWGVDRLDSGYMYCCSVEEASKKIKAVPRVTETGGLLVAQGGTERECQKNNKGVYTCPCTCSP